MQKIRFVKSNLEYNVSLKSNVNRIVCTFENESDAKNAPISEGFVEINEHNGVVQGHYEQYKYIYNKESDGVTVTLTTDKNDAFVEVKPSVTFSASVGGTIDGETVQTVDTYAELVIPTPIANENYKFVEWSPSIPNKGDITESVSFVAIFEYVPTEEELLSQLEIMKQDKISELSSACESAIYRGVDLNEKHYSYTLQDQSNLENAINISSQTGLDVPYHADGESCALYSLMQLQEIYVAEQVNLTKHQTYFNQMKRYILDTFTDINMIDELQSIVYGTELTGTYLDSYNNIIEQSTLIVQTFLGE